MYDLLVGMIKEALLAGQQDRANILKFFKNDLDNARKSNPDHLDGNDIDILRKAIKQRQDAQHIFLQAGDQARADKEIAEIEVLSVFLPEQVSFDQILETVKQTAATDEIEISQPNMGRLIGLVSSELGDSASKSDIANAVKSLI